MDEKEDVVEELNLEEIAEAILEDEAAEYQDPDTIDIENLKVEGASQD